MLREKKNVWRLTLLACLAIAFVFFGGRLDVKAYAAGVTQTTCEPTRIGIVWDNMTTSSRQVTAYKVSIRKYSDSNSQYSLIKTLPANQTQTTIDGLVPGSLYYVKVEYDFKNSTGRTYTYSISSSTSVKTAPGDIVNLHQEKWWFFILRLDAAWDKQDGVDGYEYECYKSNGKLLTRGTTRSASADIGGIKNEMIYTVRARAYATFNGQPLYGNWSAPIYCFTQPRITKAKVSGNKLTVSWKKVSGATKYAVYASTSPTKGYKKVATVSAKKGSVTVKKLGGKKINKKKKYYVYVVTLKKVNGVMNDSGRLYYWNTKNKSFGYF